MLPAVSAGNPDLWEQPADEVQPEAGQETCGGALPGLPWQETLSSSVHNPLWDEESISNSRLQSSPRVQPLCESAVVHVRVAQLRLDGQASRCNTWHII